MWFKVKDGDFCNTKNIKLLHKHTYSDGLNIIRIDRDDIEYETKEDRDEDFERLERLLTKKGSKMEILKDYFRKNQDTFMTILVLLWR